MTLCSLCQSIPFTGLPQLPSAWQNLSLVAKPERQQFLNLEKSPPARNEPVGFPHHLGLEVLGASAVSCELCDLINESVIRFISAYHEAEQDPVFVYYNRSKGISVNSQLWLTRRLDRGDGFLVFVHAQSNASIFLVGAVGFCVDDDSPLASVFRGRPIEEEAGTEKVLNRAAFWMHNCVEKHEYCIASTVQLPSRLLDLDCSSGTDVIRLWETEGARGHYATLSHCWGDTGHFTTSRASIAARRQGINIEELPKTFQDAVAIARRVGMRYLWIDSLCICQDDPGDWECESANMSAVYSNSYLTIAATGAQNNTVGCFIRRPGRRHIPIDFTTEDGTSGQLLVFRLPLNKAALSRRYLEMRDQALTKRAWALQERKISQRILHYCTDQMYYECNEEFVGEDGLREQGRYDSLFPALEPTYRPWLRESQHSTEISLWYRLLEDYSSRQLTKPSDKLPALSGLASVLGARIKGEYVAGLWSNALIESLAWTRLGGHGDPMPTAPRVYRAPSWSWASCDGIVASGKSNTDEWLNIATVLDYHVELKGANPYGEVTDGWITLQAPLMPLSLSDIPEKDEDKLPKRRSMRMKTLGGNPFGTYANFDSIRQHNDETRAHVMSLQLFALVLAQKGDYGKDNDSNDLYQTLIVVPEGSGSARMRRMGILLLDNDRLGNRKVIEDSSEFTTVTLV